jgi:hypothetical protein
MFALIASVLILVLITAALRRIAAVPLFRTLSASINCWAETVRRQ